MSSMVKERGEIDLMESNVKRKLNMFYLFMTINNKIQIHKYCFEKKKKNTNL